MHHSDNVDETADAASSTAKKTGRRSAVRVVVAALCVAAAIGLGVFVGFNVAGREASTYVDISRHGARADDPKFDNAPIINEIIDEMPQTGGTIYIPAGNYHLLSSVVVDRSYITIAGDAASVRSGVDADDGNTQAGGGGSMLIPHDGVTAITVKNSANNNRISGVTFRDFQIKGIANDGYGIDAQSDNDRIVIDGMVINNVGVAIRLNGADAARISDSWIAETMSGIELTGASQQAVITGNSIGAQPQGVTILLENPDRYNITGNTIYPDGATNIRLTNPKHGVVSGNTISSYYNAAVELVANDAGETGNGNVIDGNVISVEGYQNNPEGRDSSWGIVHLEGDGNIVSDNTIIADGMRGDWVGVNVAAGDGNRLDSNIIGYGNDSSAKVLISDGVTNTRVSGTVSDSQWSNESDATNTNGSD